MPCEPGQPEKVDLVYIRNDVADVLMISEPLAGRRETVVTKIRTALDFAEILRYTSDTLYLRAEKIVLATDNFNTHSQLHCIRHSRQRKHTGWQNALNDITRQNTGVGWTWQRLKSAS